MSALRIFLAIETPPQIKEPILDIITELKQAGAEVNWEPSEKLHTTLKFLGDVGAPVLGNISAAVEGICAVQNPIMVRYSGVGSFPDGRNPKVIWIGIDDLNGQLRPLNASLENAMAGFGFERELREFKGHLTIGRVKGKKRLEPLLRKMETLTFQSEPVVIDKLALVKSELRPSGSVYTVLQSFPFRTRNQ
jgi:2'-5' RNA ligase